MKTITKREPQNALIKAQDLARELYAYKSQKDLIQEYLDRVEPKLIRMIKKLQLLDDKLVLKDGIGFQVQKKTRTVVKSKYGAQQWALKNPAARMVPQVSKITEELAKGEKLTFATRIHTEELHRIHRKPLKLKSAS